MEWECSEEGPWGIAPEVRPGVVLYRIRAVRLIKVYAIKCSSN